MVTAANETTTSVTLHDDPGAMDRPLWGKIWLIDHARDKCAERLTEDEVTGIDILKIQGCALELFHPCGQG